MILSQIRRLSISACSISALLISSLTHGEKQRLQGTPVASISLKELHIGTPEIDLRLLESYEKVSDEDRAFFVETRQLFERTGESITFEHPNLLAVAEKHNRPLLGGPMLGNLFTNGVSIWLRPSSLDPISITVQDSKRDKTHTIESESPTPGKASRFLFGELHPETNYTYRVTVDGDLIAEGSFTTTPENDASGVFKMAFGADFHKIGQHNPALFNSILKRDPSVMLLLGDSAADDRRENMNLHRADYFSRDVSPPWKSFAPHVPVYAIWDDHDYFDDDLSGLQDGAFTEADRDAIRKVWKNNWNNPATPQNQEGIYFSTRLGPVEVFMLDTRSCRNWKIRGEYTSYLGAAQQDWLIEGLKNSTAPFKLLASGTMWSDYVSKGKDSWATWDTEALEEIFDTIEVHQISGVILLSGDRHGARGFHIPRESGHQFLELGVGSLGGINGPPGIVPGLEEQLFGYDGQGFTAFGEFSFDTRLEDPTVTFRLIGEYGKILEEHIWTQSELTP